MKRYRNLPFELFVGIRVLLITNLYLNKYRYTYDLYTLNVYE